MGFPVLSGGAGGGMSVLLRYSPTTIRLPLTRNGWTDLYFDSVEVDQNGSYDFTQNAVIIPATGRYAVGLSINLFHELEAQVTFTVGLQFTVDGTPVKDSADGNVTSHNMFLGSRTADSFYLSGELELSRGQVLKGQVWVGADSITQRSGQTGLLAMRVA